MIPAWFLAIALWIYSIWCFGRALKHPAPGIEAWRAWLWRNADLSSEGLKFRRRGSRAMLGFVAVVLGVFALAWLFGVSSAKANPMTERPNPLMQPTNAGGAQLRPRQLSDGELRTIGYQVFVCS